MMEWILVMGMELVHIQDLLVLPAAPVMRQNTTVQLLLRMEHHVTMD